MSFLLPFIPAGIAAMYVEHSVLPDFVAGLPPTLLSRLMTQPRSYGLVIIVNIIATGFFLAGLGMKVGKSRAMFRDKAIKDGEKDAEERFMLPNLYVEGNTPNAKKFNCVQRGHQQALETYPQFLALSLCGGYRFPLLTTAVGLLWMYARGKWAEGYASGDPASRYQHWASKGIWLALVFASMAALGSALSIMEVI